MSESNPHAAYLRELYAWILQRYELYKQDKISEEAYQKDLKYYSHEVETVAEGSLDSGTPGAKPSEVELNQIEEEKGISATSKSVAELRDVLLKDLGAFKKRYNIDEQ